MCLDCPGDRRVFVPITPKSIMDVYNDSVQAKLQPKVLMDHLVWDPSAPSPSVLFLCDSTGYARSWSAGPHYSDCAEAFNARLSWNEKGNSPTRCKRGEFAVCIVLCSTLFECKHMKTNIFGTNVARCSYLAKSLPLTLTADRTREADHGISFNPFH